MSMLNHYSKIYLRNARVLLVVPNIQLNAQMKKDFSEYGMPEELLYMFIKGSDGRSKCPVWITNRDWMNEHFDVMPKDFDVVIVDECHQLKKGNNCCKLISSLETPMKIGLTGTLPEEKYDEWNVKGILGPVVYDKEVHEMQNAGHIAQIKIKCVRFDISNRPRFKYETPEEFKTAHVDEYEFIEASEVINSAIVKLATKLPGNTLILFNHTSHGMAMMNILEKTHDHEHNFFVNGSTELAIREDVRTLLEESDSNIAIANSACFSTGINIKNISNIILSAGGKATVRTIQSLGRGLRLKEGKTHLNLIDISVNMKYSMSHFAKREDIYKNIYNKTINTSDIKKIIINA